MCESSCALSTMPTGNGIPVVLSVEDGRFPCGCFHEVCADCPQWNRGRRKAPWKNLRDIERERRVIGPASPL
jgi:hypothetical protein